MLTQRDLQKISEIVKAETDPIKKVQKSQGKDIKYLKKTLDVAIDHFDKRNVKMQKEIIAIKHHIGISAE
jgi:hypothetical protein